MMLRTINQFPNEGISRDSVTSAPAIAETAALERRQRPRLRPRHCSICPMSLVRSRSLTICDHLQSTSIVHIASIEDALIVFAETCLQSRPSYSAKAFLDDPNCSRQEEQEGAMKGWQGASVKVSHIILQTRVQNLRYPIKASSPVFDGMQRVSYNGTTTAPLPRRDLGVLISAANVDF